MGSTWILLSASAVHESPSVVLGDTLRAMGGRPRAVRSLLAFPGGCRSTSCYHTET